MSELIGASGCSCSHTTLAVCSRDAHICVGSWLSELAVMQDEYRSGSLMTSDLGLDSVGGGGRGYAA